MRFLIQELAAEGREALGDNVEICWLEAGDVPEAVAHYKTVKPDAILLDNRLGPDDGVDLLPQVCQTWGCPVWILTGLSSPQLRERCASRGAAGVISKDEMMTSAGRLRGFLLQSPGPR